MFTTLTPSFPEGPIFTTLNESALVWKVLEGHFLYKFLRLRTENESKTEHFENAMTKCPAAGHGLKKT